MTDPLLLACAVMLSEGAVQGGAMPGGGRRSHDWGWGRKGGQTLQRAGGVQGREPLAGCFGASDRFMTD